MVNLSSTLSTMVSNSSSVVPPRTTASDNCQYSFTHEPLISSISSISPTQSHYYPTQYSMPTPRESLHFSYACPALRAGLPLSPICHPYSPWSRHSLQSNALSVEQETRVVNAYQSKAARSRRKLARQKNLNKRIFSSLMATTHGVGTNVQSVSSTNDPNLYNFCTPDGKRLRELLKKELKNSDVGPLGRIVLPKRAIEGNLLALSNKEGLPIVLRNAYTNEEWNLRFKPWLNNTSRMYVLEHAGEFVRQNGLENGDVLTLYEDETKNLYYYITKVKKAAIETHCDQPTCSNSLYISQAEETSIMKLIEQLIERSKPEESKVLMDFPIDISSSYGYIEEAAKEVSSHTMNVNLASMTMQPLSSQQSMVGKAAVISSQLSEVGKMDEMDIDGCYTELGALPEVRYL